MRTNKGYQVVMLVCPYCGEFMTLRHIVTSEYLDLVHYQCINNHIINVKILQPKPRQGNTT